MNDEILLATILSSSFTKQDVLRRIRILREYFEQKYFSPSSQTLASFLKKSNISLPDSAVLQSFGNEFYESFTKDIVYDKLTSLSEKIKAIATVNVYLPFAPDEKEAARLGKWFRREVKSDILLEIHVDVRMIGGAGVAQGGYFRDYSLRHYIEKGRGKIKDVLETYAHKKV